MLYRAKRTMRAVSTLFFSSSVAMDRRSFLFSDSFFAATVRSFWTAILSATLKRTLCDMVLETWTETVASGTREVGDRQERWRLFAPRRGSILRCLCLYCQRVTVYFYACLYLLSATQLAPKLHNARATSSGVFWLSSIALAPHLLYNSRPILLVYVLPTHGNSIQFEFCVLCKRLAWPVWPC